MEDIVALYFTFQDLIGSIAGFGVSYATASFSLLVAMSLFGTACISHLAERTDMFHLGFNLTAMFAAGVIGNAMLRGLHLPLGHELLITTALSLTGMMVMAVILLFTYRRTDF